MREKAPVGAANEFCSLEGAARILTWRAQFDEALATLHRADIETRKGYWRHAVLLSLGEILAAAGRKDEALKTFRSVLADESALKSHREAEPEAIKSLESVR